MPALRATTSFIAPGRVKVKRGQIVDSADPIVKGREHLFETPEATIERASAAPGEKRSATKRPAKKAAAPKAAE